VIRLENRRVRLAPAPLTLIGTRKGPIAAALGRAHSSPLPMSQPAPVILGLDPGTRYLGFALIRGPELLEYGVRELKNGQRPYDVVGQARETVLRLIAVHGPGVVAIEQPLRLATPRAAVLSTLTQEIHQRAREIGARVLELGPADVRKRLTGDANATKYAVAQWLARERHPELARLVPQRPKLPALWLTSRERYWLHMLDALALAEVAKIQCLG
jgi:Holliday junction resolvasome RuvABC endonuclease subunit